MEICAAFFSTIPLVVDPMIGPGGLTDMWDGDDETVGPYVGEIFMGSRVFCPSSICFYKAFVCGRNMMSIHESVICVDIYSAFFKIEDAYSRVQ